MLALFQDGARDALPFLEEKASLGLWTWDLKSRAMEWSPGLFRLFGLEPGSAKPSQALAETLTHPQDRLPPGEIDRALRQPGPLERQFRIVLGDDRCRHILNRGEVLLGADGRPDRAIGIMLDVTRLSEAERNADALRERCSRIIGLIPAMVWSANSQGAVEEFSGWDKFTEQPLPGERTGSWLDCVHPEDRANVDESWHSALARASTFQLEFRLHRIGGTYRWMRARGSPRFNGDGSVREWMVVCVDIHEQKVWSPAIEFLAITGAQLRAARGILNWSVRDLADTAGISPAVIRRLEEIDGLPPERDKCFGQIKKALEAAGVEFLFPPVGKPGVRPATQPEAKFLPQPTTIVPTQKNFRPVAASASSGGKFSQSLIAASSRAQNSLK